MTRYLRTPVGVAAPVLLAALLSLPGYGQQLSEPSGSAGAASALISRVIEKYESAATCRLDFVQESYWALADTTAENPGTLFVERPSRISIHYGDGGRVVANAESLWVYVPQTHQFFIAPVDSSDMVFDPAKLLRHYCPDPDAPGVRPAPEGHGAVIVNLVPIDALTEPGRLRVTVESSDHTVSRIEAVSGSGDRTTYAVKTTLFNLRIPDSEFRLTRPQGADVIVGGSSGGY